MLIYYVILVLGLYLPMSFCMDCKPDVQLELCPNRRAYLLQRRANDSTEKPICFFCDEKSMASNYVISEDPDKDVRVMMNKSPYFHCDQGDHLLVMSLTHKEEPSDFTEQELNAQVDEIQRLSSKLRDDAYTQEYFINWSAMAGQTVPHMHSHLKVYKDFTRSLPEMLQVHEIPKIKTVLEAFEIIKQKLQAEAILPDSSQKLCYDSGCLSCLVNKDQENDKKNLVVGRFEHNLVCLSHYPSVPGELSIIPYDHVASISDLPQAALRENVALAMALLPKMKEYAANNIRECDGGNVYTKSMGKKADEKQKQKYHVHTLVMPRTSIVATPGTVRGDSCKLDCNAKDLLEYLQKKVLQDIKVNNASKK